jgi:signal transduction histidine kinase
VRLEYQLVGADRQWVDGSASRVASYTRLRPGRYQFRVRAWNEDGVPGANEASVAFTVARTWYETYWFAAFALLAFTALVSGGAFGWQRSRARQREAHLQARFEATLAERARVARELHDTLLSGFTGITLQLQALQRKMSTAPHRVSESLSTILTSADASLRDARMMIWDLRGVPVAEGGLVAALERAARDAVAGTAVDTRVVVHGDPRELPALLETTLLRVGREAVINAVRHANAGLVRLQLTYHSARVELTVTDDGRGYAPDPDGAAGLPGHWGLAGMRERAARAGGSVRVTGRSGEGTEVLVSLPTISNAKRP